MKKLAILLLAAVMLFAATGCPDGADGESSTADEGVVGGLTDGSSAATEDSVADATSEAGKNTLDPRKLSLFGLPEPAFAYRYDHYDEVSSGRVNDEPILHPQFVYFASGDNNAAYGYMETVLNAGWGGSLPRNGPESSFWYTGQKGDYKVEVHWLPDAPYYEPNTVMIMVSDYSHLCLWDDDAADYLIDGVELYTGE